MTKMRNSLVTGRQKPSRKKNSNILNPKRRLKKRARKQRYWFDSAAADRAVKFIEKYCTHTKGKWAGQPFILEPWEKDEIVRPFFGWKKLDGSRKYRTLYVFIPKKNGKSALASAIGLYLTYADNEPSAEVYSLAGDTEQAGIVFNVAKEMVLASKSLFKRGKVYKKSIFIPASGSVYRVLSSDAFTKHGYNVHGAVFDEFHVQPNRDLYDTMEGGTVARRQPAVIILTTAGFDTKSICYEVHEYALKVKKGVIKDDSFLAVIYAADKKDDWRNPKIWYKANPNLGVTVSEESLRVQARKAEYIPAYENTFRRLHLNQWVSQKSRWLQLHLWDRSAGDVDPLELEGLPCYAGLDLSSSTDLTALVLVFPVDDTFKLLPYFWIPEDNMRERIRRDKVPYDVWVRQGLIQATEGDVVDYAAILKKMESIRENFNVQEIAYDRWGASKIVQDLEDIGFKVVPFGQGFASMSPPSKEFLRLVQAKKLHHGGHPVLRWNADNVVVKTDPAENIKPDKSKAIHRIDGIVAAIMGLDRAVRNEAPATGSVYEGRGLLEMEM